MFEELKKKATWCYIRGVLFYSDKHMILIAALWRTLNFSLPVIVCHGRYLLLIVLLGNLSHCVHSLLPTRDRTLQCASTEPKPKDTTNPYSSSPVVSLLSPRMEVQWHDVCSCFEVCRLLFLDFAWLTLSPSNRIQTPRTELRILDFWNVTQLLSLRRAKEIPPPTSYYWWSRVIRILLVLGPRL